MTDYEWTIVDVSNSKAERRPYKKCPRCDEYKLTKIRQNRVTGVFTSETVKWEFCKNCKLKRDETPFDE